MLPKRQRLTTAAFNHYFRTGRRHHGRYLTLVYTPAETLHGAVVVGKKVYTAAVARNRLRRQLYPVIRAFAKSEGQTGVFQCLVKPAAATVSVDVVRAELRELLAEATRPR